MATEHPAPTSPGTTYKVGALAAATGLTVRTLHHYEDIGLLVPSQRTDAGHRLYGPDEVERLYRILLLRRLGLGLDAIGRALDDPEGDLRSAMADHLVEVEQQAAAASRLRTRLAQLLATEEATTSSPGELLDVLEDMTMLDAGVQRRLSIIVYKDLDAAYDHLTRVFGLGPGEKAVEDGKVVHAELTAGDGVIWLHRESPDFGLASPATLGSATAMVAVMVDDVDAHCDRARAEGAIIEYGPVDQPYGYREYGTRDPEGHLWSFMRPIG